MKAQEIRMIHRGKYLSYYEIDYADELGHKKTYEMCSRAGSSNAGSPPALSLNDIGKTVHAVSLLVFNEDMTKTLVNYEFRMGVNRHVVNNIAGLVENGESITCAAQRELFEETGLHLTAVLDVLMPSIVCAGVTDECVPLVVCQAKGEILGSDSIYEDIQSFWMDKRQVTELLEDREIIMASRTQALLYAWVCGAEFGKADVRRYDPFEINELQKSMIGRGIDYETSELVIHDFLWRRKNLLHK